MHMGNVEGTTAGHLKLSLGEAGAAGSWEVVVWLICASETEPFRGLWECHECLGLGCLLGFFW